MRGFLTDEGRTSYESAAVDSSFSLKFTRGKGDGGWIETAHEGVLVDRSPAKDLATAVHTAAEEFARTTLRHLPLDDAGREDHEKSLAEFEEILTELSD
ncbi:hypothetical protein AB0I00_07290 [Streptomyces sp. NPDC050803]|uniref:hypothetical protein n=1 Tax=unclassified Streptomyces TaxID=2593676 RepID=UPI00341ED1C4